MKRWVTLLKIFMSIALLATVFLYVDRDELVRRARQVDAAFLLWSVLLSFVMVAVSTWKWYYLLRCQGCDVPFSRLYRWYFIGYYYSCFIPSNIGGDVARGWLAAKATGSASASAAGIFAERFTGMVFLLMMATISPWLVPEIATKKPSVWLGSCAGIAGLAALFIVYHVAKNRSLPGLSWRVKIETFVVKLRGLLALILGDKKVFWVVTGLTALFYLLMLLNVALAFRAFGLWPDVIELAAVFPIALMVAMIPVTLGNLGIAENAYVYYFGLVGMNNELSLAMGLLLRLKIFMLAFIGLCVQMREPMGKPGRLATDET